MENELIVREEIDNNPELQKVIQENGLSIYDVRDLLNDATDFLGKVREIQSGANDLARIKSEERIAIQELDKRYDLMKSVFTAHFSERSKILEKEFKVIDEGIASHDINMILHGMSGLSMMATSSPFADLSNVQKFIESGQKISFDDL